jgi:hypothetical protein
MGNLAFYGTVAAGACGLVGAIYWYLASPESRRNRIAALWTGIGSILVIVVPFISSVAGQSPSPPTTAFNGSTTIEHGGAGVNSGTINNNFNNYNTPAASGSRIFEGAPGIPFEETEVRGVLKPADVPTPPNGCDRFHPATEDTIMVLIGDNAITYNGLGSFTAVGIGKCDAISMERREDGIFVNASLYDEEGDAVVSIHGNQITALNGERYSARQSRDESRLSVKNARGTELFYVRYLNPRTVQFRGFLGCAGGPVVHIREGQPVPGFFMSGSCLANAKRGIQIGPDSSPRSVAQ